MAKIKLHWVEYVNRDKIIDIPFPPFEEDEEFTSYDSLLSNIKWRYEDIIPYDLLINIDEFTDSCEFNFIEIIDESELEEIAKNYLHLIKKPQVIKLSCCIGQIGNYCSICGNKLN